MLALSKWEEISRHGSGKPDSNFVILSAYRKPTKWRVVSGDSPPIPSFWVENFWFFCLGTKERRTKKYNYLWGKNPLLTNPEKHIIIISLKATTRDKGFDRVFQRAVHFGESIVLQSPILPPFSFFGVTTEDGLPVTGTRDEIFSQSWVEPW